MSEHRFDDAIDRIVRSMMDVDPRPGLRQRVLGRLDAPRTPSLAVRRLAAAGVLLAAAALVARLFFTGAPAPTEQRTAVPAGPGGGIPPIERAIAHPSGAVASSTPFARPRPAGRTRRQDRMPDDIPPFVSNVHVEPLGAIPPIVLPPVGTPALESHAISIPPLAPIEPVRVDPLSSMQY